MGEISYSLQKNVYTFAADFYEKKMVENKNLCHTGIVKSVDTDKIVVSIISQAACVSCQVKGSCSSSEIKEKEVEVTEWEGHFAPGDSVEVMASKSQGYRALFFGYLLPLILVVATLAGVNTVAKHEALAALGALGILLPYYFILFLFRSKLRNTLRFRIRKQLNFKTL